MVGANQLDIVIQAKDQASREINTVKGHVKDLEGSTKSAGNTAASTGGMFSGMGGVVAAGVAVAATAAVAFGVASVNAFEESERAGAQLNAVLASTKGIAGVTRQSAIDLSQSLSKLNAVDDEAVLGGESMLLTFTNISKDIFPETTQAAIDMATAMNGGITPSAEELRNQAIQLGKALQDPDAGLGALHRVGVNVDELKKKFTDSMPIQEKQKLILQELATEFGGSGAAAAKTFGGQIKMLQVNFQNFMETIGGGIASVLNPALDWFNNLFNSAGGVDGIMKTLSDTWSGFVHELDRMGIIKGLQEAWTEIGKNWNEYIVPALKDLWNTIQTELVPALKDLWEQVGPTLGPALKYLAIILGAVIIGAIYALVYAIKGLVEWYTLLAKGITAFVAEAKRQWDQFKMGWDMIVSGVTTAINWLNAQWTGSQKAVADFVNGVINWFNQLPTMINNAISAIVQWLQRLPYNFGLVLGQVVRFLIDFATVTVPNWINSVINWFAMLPGRVQTFMINTYNSIVNWMINAFNGAVNWTANMVNNVVNWIAQLPGRAYGAMVGLYNTIVGWLNNAANGGRNAAGNLVNGFIGWIANLPGQVWGIMANVANTIGGFGSWLYNKGKEIASQVWNGFKQGLGIHSPSYIERAFMAIEEQGKNTVGQMKSDISTLNTLTTAATKPFVQQAEYIANNNAQPSNVNNNNQQHTEVNYNGPIQLSSAEAVNQFFKLQSRNQELVSQGLTPLQGV